MRRISVDIGGTFTDCFCVWDEHYVQAKALTSHHNLAQGWGEALDRACEQLSLSRAEVLGGVDSVRYATTLGTNALVERRGPTIGAVVTAGFDDTIPLARGRGYGEGLDELGKVDKSGASRPVPLVAPTMIKPVRQRMDHRGQVLLDLDDEGVRSALRTLVDDGAEAIVVCLTNSVENPDHELRVQQLFAEEFPAYQLGAVPLLLSHQVSGRKGEYVRATSTIVDAFLHETMRHGLSELQQDLRENGYTKPMLVSHNSGGMAQLGSTDALQTVHSGPVAGIAASEALALASQLGNVVATDMGGTSFDIGLVPADGVKHYDFTPTVDRWLVSLPMVHLVTLGAGGGSIASYDRMHRSVAVGPQSAGSDPGPACYDRGGRRPTVTDADLLLGYLDAEAYAGGRIRLSRSRAELAMEDAFDEHLDLTAVEVAALVRTEVDEQMASGLGKELRVRGYLPQEFTMLAYGGNGPLHCCGIAARLGITRVLAPPFTPVFSALGAGNTAQLHIHERSVALALYDATSRTLLADTDRFNEIVAGLEARGRDDLLRQGMAESDIRHRLELDMRYGDQLVTTAVVLDRPRLAGVTDVVAVLEQFATSYSARFGAGSQSPEAGVRITTVRVATYVDTPTLDLAVTVPTGAGVPATPAGERRCWFPGLGHDVATPSYDEAALVPGAAIRGPAVMTTPATTYLVDPGWVLRAGEHGAVWFLSEETA